MNKIKIMLDEESQVKMINKLIDIDHMRDENMNLRKRVETMFDNRSIVYDHLHEYGFIFDSFSIHYKNMIIINVTVENSYIFNIRYIENDEFGLMKNVKRYKIPYDIYWIAHIKCNTSGALKNKLEKFSFNIIDAINNDNSYGLSSNEIRALNLTPELDTDDIKKLKLLFDVITYSIFISINKEVVYKEPVQKWTSSSDSKSSKTKTVYTLDDFVIKYTKHINHCKHNITCEHWNVRGHFRHYKNGKTVWIKPFEKGKNKESNTTSTYTI